MVVEWGRVKVGKGGCGALWGMHICTRIHRQVDRQIQTAKRTMMRATISALETPRDLGMSSPKTSVTTVSPTVE